METAYFNKEKTLQLARDIVAYGLDQGYSIAIWRLPNQNLINLILSAERKQLSDVVLEECKPGFIYSPFNPTQPKYFLQGDHQFEINEDSIVEKTPGQIKNLISTFSSGKPLKFYTANISQSATPTSEFKELVKLCINSIEAGTFEKVVPSMQKRIEVSLDFDLLDSFNKLVNRYPAAMVSLVSDSVIGTWLGASPELLVSTDKHGIFRTIALAGTQQFNENTSLKNISWTQKEIEEQALVERYIISCFKKIRVREYDEHGPKTVQAGNLLHLKSDFEVDMKEVNYPQLGSVMLNLLHPTSAVCGMPMENSFKFLQENEYHDREFYAGYLGPVNIDQETHIYVNLRCLKWMSNYIMLFAGAGVTIDSIPEDEEMEVNMKMKTLLSVIDNKIQ